MALIEYFTVYCSVVPRHIAVCQWFHRAQLAVPHFEVINQEISDSVRIISADLEICGSPFLRLPCSIHLENQVLVFSLFCDIWLPMVKCWPVAESPHTFWIHIVLIYA
jgi:hypothetical protein